MKFDFSNKVLEDMVQVLSKELKQDGVISDKTDHIIQRKNLKVYPFVFKEENPYREIRQKIMEYWKNRDKYIAAGFENVEQFQLYINLKRRKLFGKEKRVALFIQDYIHNRTEYLKMGFLSMGDFITYREYFDKTQNYEKAAYLYSTEKEYEREKKKYREKGVYSLLDYRQFSEMMELSLSAFTKEELYKKIPLSLYLSFELREYRWKKEYFEKNGSLKGVGEYIREKYTEGKESIVLGEEYPYFLEPGYYYEHNRIRNFGELYTYYEKMAKARHRYASEKPEEEYLMFMFQSIRGKNHEKLL